MKQSNYSKVLDVFFDNPTERFHIREVGRITGLNPNTVLNVVKGLVKEGLVIREKKKHIVELSTNVDEGFRELKIVRNLERIYRSGLIKFLNKYFKNPKAIVLFGSVRKGEDMAGSDIDIAIEDDNFEKYEIKRLDEMKKFEKELGKEIQLHLFNKKKIDVNVFNNILNGIVLSGFLEV